MRRKMDLDMKGGSECVNQVSDTEPKGVRENKL